MKRASQASLNMEDSRPPLIHVTRHSTGRLQMIGKRTERLLSSPSSPYLPASAVCSARQHITLNGTEPRAQAIIEYLVANADDQPADQRWIDVETELQSIAIALA